MILAIVCAATDNHPSVIHATRIEERMACRVTRDVGIANNLAPGIDAVSRTSRTPECAEIICGGMDWTVGSCTEGSITQITCETDFFIR